MLMLLTEPSVAGIAMIVSALRRRLANLRLSNLRHIMVRPFRTIISPVTLSLDTGETHSSAPERRLVH